jgi:hypothetical protein
MASSGGVQPLTDDEPRVVDAHRGRPDEAGTDQMEAAVFPDGSVRLASDEDVADRLSDVVHAECLALPGIRQQRDVLVWRLC